MLPVAKITGTYNYAAKLLETMIKPLELVD